MTANKIVEREGSKCLSKFYQSKIFSDLVIINYNTRYAVHKIILATASPYFDKMLTDKNKSQIKEITFHHSTEALEMIIKWIYSQPITLTQENVRELAELADDLEIPELIPHCLTFLCQNSSDSIFSDFSNFINHKKTRKMVERYICLNFRDIVSTDEFSSYDFETLYDILSLEDLNMENELDVFDAIIKWIAADPQHRRNNLGELMKKIHWISVDKTKFMDVASNTYVKSCKNARTIMKSALDLMAFDVSEESKRRKLIDRTRQNQKCFLLRFDKPSSDKVHFKSSDHPQASICLERDNELINQAPSFFDANLADYNTNSSQVIRIDWKNRKFRLYGSDSFLCSCLFGYRFIFANKAIREVLFEKGSRFIQLGQIPDYYSSLMSIAPYKGHFYIVVKEKQSESEFNFRISKFDPIKNIWTHLSKAPEKVPSCCTKVIMKISNGKLSLFFGERKKDEKNLFMSSIHAHWIYNINEGSWSDNKDFVLNSKSDPEILNNLSNEIQCFENQFEFLKITNVSVESL